MEDKFIKSLYDIMLKENIVTKQASTSKEKKELANAYFEKIERVNEKIRDQEERIKRIKELYYKRYVIKESDISESYWRHLEEEYLDEGQGHVNLVNPRNEVERELRREHTRRIIEAQKSSIDGWLNYFMSKDSDYLPMWGKVWAFMGMLKIGVLNKEKTGFNKRSKDTIEPFISIDSELVGKSIEYLKKHLKREKIEDEELERLVRSETFKTIYEYLYLNKKEIIINGNEGIWVKYKEDSKEDARVLYESLEGYNTGWCTATSLETAVSQVCGGGSYEGGDFYVYYTKNESNEYKIPRLAIRMNRNKIGEIRGIAKNQNIEADMEEVLEEKLEEFPDKEEYQKRIHDMRMLTKLYKQKDFELTKEELEFLYEIREEITEFGYQRDPRIKEIKDKRNEKEDYATIFNCTPEEVASDIEELRRSKYKIKVYLGNINKSEDLSEHLIYVKEYVNLDSLTTAEGLNLPQIIGGYLDLRNLTRAEGLMLPQNIGGDLYLRNLTEVEGLTFPQRIGGSLYLDSLVKAKDLVLPQTIGGYLDLSSLIEVEGLILPQIIGASLNFSCLTSVKGLTLPQRIGGYLNLNSLTSVEGLILPKIILGSIFLENLQINDILNIELPNSANSVRLKDFTGSLEELKNIIKMKKEKINLNEIKDKLSEYQAKDEQPKRGSISISMIIIPAITVILGIIIASILYL